MTRERTTITVSESMEVACPPEDVFDYTQDYGRRTEWDRSVTETRILSESPRRIRIEVRGLGRFTVAYRLFRRPERTSAAFVDSSRAGSAAEAAPGATSGAEGTRWTQTNTLELKRPRLLRFLAPLIERNLRTAVHRSMAEARRILEA